MPSLRAWSLKKSAPGLNRGGNRFSEGSCSNKTVRLYPIESARITVYRQQRCVELAHRKLATRERAPLVTIELLEPAGKLVAIEALGIQVALGLPHPHNLDMRRCDLRCTLAPIGACSLTRDRARKLSDRPHKLRVEPRRAREPVTERVAGRA